MPLFSRLVPLPLHLRPRYHRRITISPTTKFGHFLNRRPRQTLRRPASDTNHRSTSATGVTHTRRWTQRVKTAAVSNQRGSLLTNVKDLVSRMGHYYDTGLAKKIYYLCKSRDLDFKLNVHGCKCDPTVAQGDDCDEGGPRAGIWC